MDWVKNGANSSKLGRARGKKGQELQLWPRKRSLKRKPLCVDSWMKLGYTGDYSLARSAAVLMVLRVCVISATEYSTAFPTGQMSVKSGHFEEVNSPNPDPANAFLTGQM